MASTPNKGLEQKMNLINRWVEQFYRAKKAEGVSSYTITFYQQQMGHFQKYCKAQEIDEFLPQSLRKRAAPHQQSS